MANDEVELSGDKDDSEYEVVPVGPIRRLEKRIDEIEGGQQLSQSESLIRDMIDMMKTNQQMVNSMVQSSSELRNSVEDLTHKMDDVLDNMSGFMELLEEASEASLEEDVSHDLGESLAKPITNKMDELRQTNERMLEGLSSLGEGIDSLDQRMKRMYASQKEEPFSRSRRRRSRSRSRDRGDRERGDRDRGEE